MIFLGIWNPHTGKMRKSKYPWKTLIYDHWSQKHTYIRSFFFLLFITELDISTVPITTLVTRECMIIPMAKEKNIYISIM
jgi:hypothetical protein